MTAIGKLIFLCSLLTMVGGCSAHTNTVAQNLPFSSYLFVSQQTIFQVCKSQMVCDPKCPSLKTPDPQQGVPEECPEECQKDEEECQKAQTLSTGSGIIIAYDGKHSYGMTAAHVCLLHNPPGMTIIESKIQVQMLGGASFVAEVDAMYIDVDICVLKIKKAKLPYVKMSPNAPVRGQAVLNIASPLGIFDPIGMTPIFSGWYAGPTSSQNHIHDTYTIPATAGSSGSGVFDEKGRLLGITSMAIMNFPNFILASPYTATKSIVDSYQEKRHVSLKGP